MGNIIKDNLNKVLYGNNKVYEVTASVDANIVPANIVKDVTILGVTGTAQIGEPPAVKEDVVFIDYDGTVIQRYTFAEAAALQELPSNPSHTGLVSQGWNWTLAEVQAAATNQEKVIAGQLYTTDDGKTRVYITIPSNNYWIELGYYQTASYGVEVDFGDISGISKMYGTNTVVRLPHCFETAGDYMITLNVVSGSAYIGANDTYGLLEINSQQRRQYTNTQITEVNIGNGITTIRTRCFFAGWNNFHISIPTTVTSFEQNCFDSTYLESVIFPRVTSLPQYIFSYCRKLVTVSLPPTCTTIGNYAFQYCYLLENINTSKLTTFGYQSFLNCYNLKKCDFHSAVTINESAFGNDLNLQRDGDLSLPNLTSVTSSAFQSCHNIRRVTSLGNITSTPQHMFRYCKGLEEVTLPLNITSISGWTFNECFRLQTINIPSTVTSIGESAFQSCLSLVTSIPTSVLTFGNRAFQSCNLKGVDLDLSNATSIGTDCFRGTGIRSVKLSTHLTTVGTYLFQGCNLMREVTIPSGYTTIADSAFRDCGALEEVTLPATVTSIQANAFNNCVSIINLTVLATTPPTLSNSNAIPDASGCVRVPEAAVSAYRTATNWSTWKYRIRPIGTVDFGTLLENYRLNRDVLEAWPNTVITDYIPIVDGHSFTFSIALNDNSFCAISAYNANREYINYWNASAWDRTVTLTVSGQIAYVRMTIFKRGLMGRAYLYDNTTDTLLWPNYITT